MLSALGALNAELLTVHYGPTMPPAETVLNLARRAAFLKHRAREDLHTARGQQLAIEEEVELATQAAYDRHVARHTINKHTLCVGPCLRVPRAQVAAIAAVVERLHGDERTAAVSELAARLRHLSPSDTYTNNPRLCVATGLPCAVAQFAQSDDVQAATAMGDRVNEAARRVRHAEEVWREACHTVELARDARVSQVREMEVSDTAHLRGGGIPPAATHANITRFLASFGIRAPLKHEHNNSMKTALDMVSKRFSTRGRERIVRDLWMRWLHFV